MRELAIFAGKVAIVLTAIVGAVALAFGYPIRQLEKLEALAERWRGNAED